MATGNARTHFHYTSKLNPLVATAKTSLVERNALPVIPAIFVDGVQTNDHRPARRRGFTCRHHSPKLNAIFRALAYHRIRADAFVGIPAGIGRASNLQTFAAGVAKVRRNNRSAAA